MSNPKPRFKGAETHAITITTEQLKLQSVELRLKRCSYQEIAKQLGISPGYACKLVQEALAESREQCLEKANELRELELQSLDELEKPLWEKYEKKDEEMLATAHSILKVKERRAKMAGLDKLDAFGEQTGIKIYIGISADDWKPLLSQNNTLPLPTLPQESTNELTNTNESNHT